MSLDVLACQHLLGVLFAGTLIGLSVAAPIGPMGMLCINRTLAQGMLVGISTGAGASTVQVCYGGVLLLGLHQVGPLLDGNKQTLNLLGAILMLLFAWRLLRARRTAPSHQRIVPGSLLVAYVSAVALNVTNPMLIVLLIGSIAMVVGPTPPAGEDIGLLLLGLFVGSVTWWIGLSSAVAMLHRRLSAGVLGMVNIAAAAALVGFGMLALARAYRG